MKAVESIENSDIPDSGLSKITDNPIFCRSLKNSDNPEFTVI